MDKEEVEDLEHQESGLGMVEKVVIPKEKQMIKILWLLQTQAKEREENYKISLSKFLWWDQETFLQEE